MTLADLALNRRDEGVEVGTPDPRATAFHRSLPGYGPTPLVEAPAAARRAGLSRLLVKVEAERFGLPSFKILGASWATAKALAAWAGSPEPPQSLDSLRSMVAGSGVGLVAATDGNHGRAVAFMARRLGLGADVLVPRDMAPVRIAAIESEGARVQIVDGDYDAAVRAAADLASDVRLVVSDTSWPGYDTVPGWVVDGYSTIFAELAEHLSHPPDVVAVQIGVGALASATVRAMRSPETLLVGVEPVDADCALRAVRDGAGATAPGPHRSLMVGLNCGVVSELALPIMRAGIDAFAAIEDSAMEDAVRTLHREGIDAGETGAAGLAGLIALADRGWPGLPRLSGSTGLVIVTEGPTDPASFARITA